MSFCCFWWLVTLPITWKGRVTYCRCGTRLKLVITEDVGEAWVTW